MQKTLLIGLGNPGEKYSQTYHNVGQAALEYIRLKLEEGQTSSPEEKGQEFRFRKCGPKRLIYPDTFMNQSGIAVKAALDWFGAEPDQAIIFHDDSDLALGEYKESTSGAAGHHGVESIAHALKDAPILRVRIGIRDPLEKNGEKERRRASEFVLSKIKEADMETLNAKVFPALAERFLAET